MSEPAVVELGLVVAADAADALAERLGDETGALAVTIEDAEAGTAGEQPVFDEPGTGAAPTPGSGWRLARICALYENDDAATRAAGVALAFVPGAQVTAISPVDAQDWVGATQAQFGPVEFAPGHWVVPTWSEVPAGARLAIRLDPGMAFGTGTHPTTRLVLAWLAADATRGGGTPRWQRVLDYGAGSGILAIAAARLGATDVQAVDIDPAAVAATRANAEANGVAIEAGLPDAARGEHDLVLANILAVPLKLLAPLLAAHLAPGGELLLAGILERQAAELQAAYAPWLALRVLASADGWILLHGRRDASMPRLAGDRSVG